MIPVVSVIIPSYNHAHLIGRALQSLIDQTYTQWEAIIVDNQSHDNTHDVIKQYDDPRIYTIKVNNHGVIAVSRNVGILQARGEWIAFLDSDDWWTKDKIELCMQYDNDNSDLIYHDLCIVGNRKGLFYKKKIKGRKIKHPTLIDLLINGNPIANSSVVVRKKLFTMLGGINESKEMIAAEDYNTWLRIAEISDKFVYIPKFLGYYLIHKQAVSQKDMSIPMRIAVSNYVLSLTNAQHNKLESFLKYTHGRHCFIQKNFRNAKVCFLFSLIHGNLEIRTKSLWMLLKLIPKVDKK